MKYQKLDSITHIHKRPDMYIGTNRIRNVSDQLYCEACEDNQVQILCKPIMAMNDGFARIFLEALSNAIDNFFRSQNTPTPLTKITVELDRESGWTSIQNDGLHIPIEIHTEENIYIPELIFGHLLSGSNLDDDEQRQTSGRNGLGVKLLNVFSQEFKISCFDPDRQLLYEQRWTDHMKHCHKPKIRKKTSTKGYTKLSWLPDFQLFGMTGYDDSHCSLYQRYLLDAGMITKIPVYWNDRKYHFKNLAAYVDLFPLEERKKCDGILNGSNFSIEYVICEQFLPLPSISFVNGIYTKEGGVHVDRFSMELFRQLAKKLSKLKIMPKDLKQYFTIFLNVSVINPEFSSQSKTKMVSSQSDVQIDLPVKHVQQIAKWNFVQEIQELNRVKEIMNLKKNEKKRGFRRIDGLDPANLAGTKHSKDCQLILCEGLSAKTYSTLGISKGYNNRSGRNYFGIYPLRGKCLNVRNATIQSIANNKEISDVIRALNLKFDVDYTKEENFKTLYYGKVCIITDADEDGHHICSLILNFFHKLFPTLFDRSEAFLSIMMTPIAKITIGSNVQSFYNDYDYQQALEQVQTSQRSFQVKYYKGLGTSSNAEILETFGEKIVDFFKDEETANYMNKIFHKNFSSDRKQWLLQYDPTSYIVPSEQYPITTYFNQELIKYSMEDCKRSIPNIYDGLKVSQRKCLFSVFKKNLQYHSKSMKVAQLAGYCAEHSNYHHGENCLFETIIKMSHHFPGSNNIPFFERDGQFGSRSHGGKDAANARYIFTKLAPLTRLLFPAEDDVLLNYTLDDGDKVEPDYYLPILPTSLLNGCTAGIGTGWSCFIPCFPFRELLFRIREYLRGNREAFFIDPDYYGYGGSIEKIDSNRYRTVGKLSSFTKKNKVYYEIRELPIGVWTDKYKEELESMQEQKKIKNLKNYSGTEKIHFVFEPVSERINETTMKLSSTLHLTNMVLFSQQNRIQRFSTIQEIFDEYFEKRYELYGKRIQYQINILEQEVEMLDNKTRFLNAVIEGQIKPFDYQEDDLENRLETLGFSRCENRFDYLLSIPIRSMTRTRYGQLMEKMRETEKKLALYRKVTPEELWEKDLHRLEAQYKKFYSLPHEMS